MTAPVEVVLAGGNDRSMLAAARSLHRHGIPFVAVGVGSKGMVAASRALRSRAVPLGPDVRADPAGWVDHLLDVVQAYDARLVLPLTDRTLLACDLRREAIVAEAVLGAGPSGAVRNILDKRANLETARQLGIPCPVQFELERLEDLPELIEHVGFPMVLKNPTPSVVGERRLFDFRWLVARDRRELEVYLRRCGPRRFPLFQRFATGTLRSVCCFASAGEVVVAHEYRDVRSLGSYSVIRENTPVSPDLRRYAELMLRELRWEGAVHIEFFVDESTGDVRYLETNGRFWASLEGAVAAGWDYPLWTYEYFAHGMVPEAPPESTGVGLRSRWNYGDLEVLVRLLGGGDDPRWAGRSRLGAVADYLSEFRPGTHADVFRLDDPMPELVEHWQGGMRAARRLLRGGARRGVRRSR